MDHISELTSCLSVLISKCKESCQNEILPAENWKIIIWVCHMLQSAGHQRLLIPKRPFLLSRPDGGENLQG